MAGRYLVIEFDDEAQANAMRARIDKATREGKKYRIIGLFARPGKPCICSDLAANRGRAADKVKRGARFGWWVCTKCGKPRLGNHELNNLVKADEVLEPNEIEGVDVYARTPDMKKYMRYPLILGMVTYPLELAKRRAA